MMTEVCAKWRQERLKSRDLSSRSVLALRTIRGALPALRAVGAAREGGPRSRGSTPGTCTKKRVFKLTSVGAVELSEGLIS